jgi:hypothetical protein
MKKSSNNKGPRRSGTMLTSMPAITRKAAKTPQKQSSTISGGYPINFGGKGSGSKSSKKSSGRRTKRSSMY